MSVLSLTLIYSSLQISKKAEQINKATAQEKVSHTTPLPYLVLTQYALI